ncbi:MAG: PPK2 family polyphosphate kinase [Bdellovibrionota bacterium]
MTQKQGGSIELNSKSGLKLSKIPTCINAHPNSEPHYKSQLKKNHAALKEFQTLLYSGHAKALLIIFQGMDTAGKDGAIEHVMSGVNPQGCSVVSFKTPTSAELDHDFFWRANQVLPARGMIGIFNRSYYEEALITRVHPELLLKEKLPSGKIYGNKFWSDRYRDIVNHEKYLHRQGYEIVKIFIHISKDEQKKRLMDRFSDPKKQWKISEGDVRERAFWNEYQHAYEQCLRHTGTKTAPWYIVPGDDKKSARLQISQILITRFEAMKLEYPELNPEEQQRLKKLKALLGKE